MSVALTRFLFKCLSAALIATVGATTRLWRRSRSRPQLRPEQTPQGTVRIPIRRVRLPITVTDKKGQFVPGLTKEDFVILEDKVPQTIETFSDDLALTTPLYVAVLMDTSPSTAGN